ncbi:hypothetical protein ABRP73_00910, partial [Pectobacterium polaris]|uniref:hypothetical protein n=1 Tax=Pectobacterium polaris TaxID=2042057 RepID=UPI0032ED3B3B
TCSVFTIYPLLPFYGLCQQSQLCLTARLFTLCVIRLSPCRISLTTSSLNRVSMKTDNLMLEKLCL